MPLQKETVTLNFAQGLDTLDDPNQLALGKFVSLTNTVFIKANSGGVGSLKKRNGFMPLANTLSSVSYLTNYNGALVGIGQGSIQQYSANAGAWINQGYYQPVSLTTQSLIKNAYSQTQMDSAIAPNGIGCLAYTQGDVNNTYNYALFDSSTGQIVSQPTPLPVVSTTSFAFGLPKIFNLGSSFFLVYGVSSQSGLVATQVNNYAPFSVVATNVVSRSLYQTSLSLFSTATLGSISSNGSIFDGTVASSNIVLSYISNADANNGASLIGAKISPSFVVSSASISFGSYTSAAISVCFDQSTSTVYTTISSSSQLTYFGTNYNFAQSFSPQVAFVGSFSMNFNILGGFTAGLGLYGVPNITSLAANGVMQSFYQVATYFNELANTSILPYRADNIINRPVTSIGVVGSESLIGPNMGLASKPFTMNGGTYLFGASYSNFQSSYFLINSTGSVISQFAYGNGGGYYYYGVPFVSTFGKSASIPYLIKDLIVPINNSGIATNQIANSVSSIAIANPFFTQTGINQIKFSFTSSSISAKQAGNTLSVNGGLLWSYDGLNLTENNFFFYPDVISAISTIVSSSAAKQFTTAQSYQYQVIFENTDGQGNVYRSSPSVGATINAAGAVGSAIMTISCSTPRLTYRPQTSPVKITLYRWSQAQQIYYKLYSVAWTGSNLSGSLTSTLSVSQLIPSISPATSPFYTDSLIFKDWTPDSAITGNDILYTSNNVVEDTPAPSFIATDIFDERFWGISAEDGSVWYSKPIVKNTPIEMNSLFSLFIPPIQTSQGTAQKPLCLAPMDEKQIMFCKSAILYISGSGPDITDSNNQYSEPTQIPSQVGCSNQNSIVQTPMGLMFQSDNGIWLLGRDLAVKYIGKEVEGYNASNVTSAVCVPGTNEVRFSLDNGQRLVYDMLAGQWASFSAPATIQSSTIYNGLDTFVTSTGSVYQETPNAYLDGAVPVVMSFTTGWINLSGLQGYARAYWMEILGSFQSPHTYTVGIAYDYNPAIVQTAKISPYNTIGSGSAVEQWEVAFQRQQCQSFQLTFTEISSGTAGAGVVISGISLTYGKKKTFARNISSRNKIG